MVARLEVEVDRIFLDQENPRHKPYDTQSEVIEYLCTHESILSLARDIAVNGLNPIEQFALIPDDDAGDGPTTYVVAEGNRRICALKLLHDPDLAPSKLRNGFVQAANGWGGIGPLPCVSFDDRAAVDLWLTRIHDGEQGGIGRRKWSADQSARQCQKDCTASDGSALRVKPGHAPSPQTRKSVPIFSLIARGDPPRSDDVRSLPAIAA